MPQKELHIVTHNVPWPVDFGGVVDLFYKIKTLHELGIKIHLHCFTQGRPPQEELNKYCASVHYYKRQNNLGSFSFKLPYIVNSRRSPELIKNLQKDNYPVLLEGIHCTYYLHNGQLDNRKVVVRLHNAEFEYYHHLAEHEENFFKRTYYRHESKLLKQYEKDIAAKTLIAAVSDEDVVLYKQVFNAQSIHLLPVFLPYTKVIVQEGKGCFCLYHGNLAINENEKAATWLLQQVFNDMNTAFVIAGNKPSQKLAFLAKEHPNTCLVADPSEKEMQDLIEKAHINILPSFNNTGVKLKLLNALFNSRHCIVNTAGVEGSGLESTCHIAEDAMEFKTAVRQLYPRSFTKEEAQKRQEMLGHLYNNEANARKLISWIY